jgi:hypothetical protein
VPETARPDSAVATIRVSTQPSGLLVLVDGVRVGRSPVGPLWVPAKSILVQARSDDPRRFEPGRDTVVVTPRAGDALEVSLDLRPSVLLRSVPEPAAIFLARGLERGPTPGLGGRAALDSLLGETPLRLLPSRLERRVFRLSAPEHADTLLTGEAVLALAPSGGPASIRLRRIAPHLIPAPPRPPPVYKRRWFQLAMIGAGAALTGTSALLRDEADRWYDRYLASSDSREIPRLYDRTAHYDRLAGGTLASGQVLLTTGIFLLVTSAVR